MKFSDILNLILLSTPEDKSIVRETTLFPLGSVTSNATFLAPENPVALTERLTISPRSKIESFVNNTILTEDGKVNVGVAGVNGVAVGVAGVNGGGTTTGFSYWLLL